MRGIRWRPDRDVAAQGCVFVLCVALGFPAWAYGGAETWAIYLLTSLALLLMGFGVAATILFKPDLPAGPPWPWLAPLVGLALLVAIQALNPSHVYDPLDQGLTARPHISGLPASVSAPLSINALLLLVALTAVFWAMRCATTTQGLHIAIGSVIAGATVMAVLALLQGSERERWELVGRFLNENSFAAYANLVLPVALGGARALQARARRLALRSHPGALLYFCAGLLAVSVLQCGSRAGAVITVLILVAWLVLEWRHARQSQEQRVGLWLRLALPVLPVAGLLALLGVEMLSHEFTGLESRLGGHVAARLAAAQGAWRMFLERPLFGMGAGTFQATFPYYRDPALLGFYRHAHNDWVQWLAELGCVGYALGLLTVAAAWRWPCRGSAKARLSPFIMQGMALGLVGLGLHAVIDFPFRIPAIAVLAAAWWGALTRQPWRAGRHASHAL